MTARELLATLPKIRSVPMQTLTTHPDNGKPRKSSHRLYNFRTGGQNVTVAYSVLHGFLTSLGDRSIQMTIIDKQALYIATSQACLILYDLETSHDERGYEDADKWVISLAKTQGPFAIRAP